MVMPATYFVFRFPQDCFRVRAVQSLRQLFRMPFCPGLLPHTGIDKQDLLPHRFSVPVVFFLPVAGFCIDLSIS
jgi:hypothetical protein